MNIRLLKTILLVLLAQIAIQATAQSVNFPEAGYSRILRMDDINYVRFNSKDHYSSFGSNEHKYYAQLKYGNKTFELKVFNAQSNKSEIGIYPIEVLFTKTKDDAHGEEYKGDDGQTVYNLLFSSAQHYVGFINTQEADKDDWVEGHFTVYIYEKIPGKEVVNTVFLGSGSFIYNIITHGIRSK